MKCIHFQFSSNQILIPHDQLLIEKQKGEIFVGFQEGKIKFRPTYKFDVGTNQYDTSAKGF